MGIDIRKQAELFNKAKQLSSRAKSRDLRISSTIAVKSVPSSFDSLRSLRMTALDRFITPFELMKRDDHNDPFHDADKCKWCKSRALAGYPGRDGIK